MINDYVPVRGIENGVNFDAHYKIGKAGVAYYLLGWEKKLEPVLCLCVDADGKEYEEECGEFDEVADTSRVVAVMVGDDRHHVVDIDDLVVIEEDDFCRSCGQIGCGCNVYT